MEIDCLTFCDYRFYHLYNLAIDFDRKNIKNVKIDKLG